MPFPASGSNNAALLLVKGSKTRLVGYHLFNPGSAVAYLQIFDAAAVANVTLGTTVPVLSLGVPIAGAVFIPVVDGSIGYEFLNGIVIAATATYNGSGAPQAPMIFNLAYM